MNNPFRYRPSASMAAMAEEIVSAVSSSPFLDSLFREGKMLGVLRHDKGWEIAYSGKRLEGADGLSIGGRFLPFVPPVFDTTKGLFREKEAEISALNKAVSAISAQLHASQLPADRLPADRLTTDQLPADRLPADRLPTDQLPADRLPTDQLPADRLSTTLVSAGQLPADQGECLEALSRELSELKLARALKSVKLQKWTFGQYVMRNALGERRSVLEIFEEKGIMPPAAAGDCAAPKLLQYAYDHGLEPLEIGEFWYGSSPAGPVRAQGRFYPACSWKCGPILRFMLKGLDVESAVTVHGTPRIVYEDNCLLVLDKPSGMPSVPGLDGLESLEEWAGAKLGMQLYQVHRLDQDTSGLVLFAKDPRTQSALRKQFQDRSVSKTYVAILSCQPKSPSGCVDLPLAPDYEDKPRQKVDLIQGKEAMTEYRVLESEEADQVFRLFGASALRKDVPAAMERAAEMVKAAGIERIALEKCAAREGEAAEMWKAAGIEKIAAVEFRPGTGRSHQLRVHAAHCSGLAAPILGDTLYGGDDFRRLCLHASAIEFENPSTHIRQRVTLL